MNFAIQLQQSFGNLLQSPQLFNEISRSAMIELSKIRHANHRLLPPHLVATIISQLHAIKPFQNRKSSLKFAFYFNIIRHVILANFHQLKENKVFAVVAMIYAQKLSDFYHDLQTQDKSLIILKRVAQISIINQISLKFVKKSKIFFPEYIKALILTVEKLDYSINRNIKHSSKVSADSNAYNNTQGVLNLAYSVDSEKDELIFILIGLLNYVLNQAGNFFTANAHKKDILRLHGIQSLVEKLQLLQSRLPEQIREQLIVPAEFKKYEYIEGQEEDLQNENQPIYLEQPMQVRELTPRFYNEEEGTKTKLLRKKRNKLQKKMQLEIRESTHKKLQERKVIEDVRQGKIQRQVKKDIFVLQQQTEQAKKYHRQMKKVKTIKKDSKLGRKGKDSKPKLGRKGKK